VWDTKRHSFLVFIIGVAVVSLLDGPLLFADPQFDALRAKIESGEAHGSDIDQLVTLWETGILDGDQNAEAFIIKQLSLLPKQTHGFYDRFIKRLKSKSDVAPEFLRAHRMYLPDSICQMLVRVADRGYPSNMSGHGIGRDVKLRNSVYAAYILSQRPEHEALLRKATESTHVNEDLLDQAMIHQVQNHAHFTRHYAMANEVLRTLKELPPHYVAQLAEKDPLQRANWPLIQTLVAQSPNNYFAMDRWIKAIDQADRQADTTKRTVAISRLRPILEKIELENNDFDALLVSRRASFTDSGRALIDSILVNRDAHRNIPHPPTGPDYLRAIREWDQRCSPKQTRK